MQIIFLMTKIIGHGFIPRQPENLVTRRLTNRKCMMGRLTFKNNSFIFEDGNMNQVAAILKSQAWSAINPDDYCTTSLKAANQFARFADESAERVLKKTSLQKYKAPPLPKLKFLDDHQVEGIKWILSRSRSYLAHAPGAGKTAQAIIASIFAGDLGQTIFIVPPQMTKNWEREILKWTEFAGIFPTITIVPESERQLNIEWRAEFVIVPDSMLTKSWVYQNLIKMRKKFLAVDEASRFKEAASLRSVVLFGGQMKTGEVLPGLVRSAAYTVLMDGSPMPNGRPMELWAPLYAMCPEVIDFMEQNDFGLRYCGPKINKFGKFEFKHSSHEDEFKEKIRADFMHVVTEEQLSHPERLRAMLFMNQDPRSAEQKEWEQKFLPRVNLSELTESDSQGDLARFRRELGVNKIDWVSQYVAERLESKNESVLLFAWHREVCEGLAERLSKYNPGLVMGGISSDRREGYFADFRSGKRKVIVGNIAAMGVGHNLQRADRVIFAEYSWSDEANKQCEKRASRKGSVKSSVRCDYLVVPNSLDEVVLNSVFGKARSTKRIVG